MANRFTKTQISTSIADSSDGDATCRSSFTADTNTVTEALALVLKCVTGGSSISLTSFTTLNELILHNTDGTNFVTLTFSTVAGNISGGTMKIKAGQMVCLTDVDPASTFSIAADTATVACELFVYGD